MARLTVAVDRHGSGDLATFDDRFIKEQIGDGSTVLIDISDPLGLAIRRCVRQWRHQA